MRSRAGQPPAPRSLPGRTGRARCIEAVGADPVLDPFPSSGTTAIAAKAAGVDWIGIEKSPDYVPMANERIARACCDLRTCCSPEYAAEEASGLRLIPKGFLLAHCDHEQGLDYTDLGQPLLQVVHDTNPQPVLPRSVSSPFVIQAPASFIDGIGKSTEKHGTDRVKVRTCTSPISSLSCRPRLGRKNLAENASTSRGPFLRALSGTFWGT